MTAQAFTESRFSASAIDKSGVVCYSYTIKPKFELRRGEIMDGSSTGRSRDFGFIYCQKYGCVPSVL